MGGRFERKPLLGTQVNWSHPLSKGLVGLWLFNEGSGDTVYDLSGNGNNGTLTNMVPSEDWIPNRNGYLLDFDGSDDFINVPFRQSLAFGGNDQITLSIWVRYDALGGGGVLIAQPTNEILLRIVTNRIQILLVDFSGDDRVDTVAGSVVTNVWYFVVATYDGANLKIYLNGTERGSVIPTGTYNTGASTSDWVIGGLSGGSRTNGKIDDVRIYNQAFTPQEVWLLYSDPYAIFRKSPYGRIFIAVAGDLTINVNETISLNELVQQGKGQIVRDDITVAERVIGGKGQIIRDDITAAELLQFGKGQIIRDDITITERVIQGKGQSIVDSIGIAEGINEGKGQIVRDTVTLAELVQLGKGLIVIDDITLGEKVTQGKGQILRDAITVAEKILQAKGQIVRDNISVAEDVTAALLGVGLNVIENEAISLSELVRLGKGQVIRDNVSLTESVTAVLSPLLINVFDSITVSDIATVVRSSLGAITQKIMFMLELAKIRMFSLELDQVPQFKLALEKKPQFKLEI